MTTAPIGPRLLPFGERVLGRQLLTRAERGDDDRFLRVGDGAWLSTRQVTARAMAAAGGFVELGVSRGDRVALLLPNREETVLAWFGCALLGAVEVPVNTALKGDLLRHVLADSGAVLLVTTADLLESAVPVLPAVASVRAVVLVGDAATGTAAVPVIPCAQLESADPVPPADVGPSDPVAVMYTSGTTGSAKGVVCPHAYFSCWADDTGRAVGFGPGDVLYSPLPMFHLTGQCVNVQLALVHGGRVVMDPRFSPKGFWSRMRELGTTHVWSFGSMTPLLFKEEAAPSDRDHAVRVVWSIPWPAGFGREFEERFGVRILCGYGSTEQGLTIVQPPESARPDTIGLASPHYDVAVVDDDGLPVADGEIGEIVTRPVEPASMMSGYLGRDVDTVTSWRDLWYHTGDRGVRDPDGYFRFVDRKKDAIRRRGENISAWEVESIVAMHPAIDEVAAIGVPSELGEDEVKVVATVTRPVTPRELFDFCLEQLPYYMVPRYIELVDELPKTPSLRVQKFLLRDAGVTATTWDRESEGLQVRRPSGV